MLYDGRTTALQPRANAVHSAIAQQFVNCVERYRSSSSMQMYNRKHSRRFADSVGLGDGRNQCLRAGDAFVFGNRRRDRPVVATQTNPVMPRSVTNAASFRHKLCRRSTLRVSSPRGNLASIPTLVLQIRLRTPPISIIMSGQILRRAILAGDIASTWATRYTPLGLASATLRSITCY